MIPVEAVKQISELYPVKIPKPADSSYSENAETFLWYLWVLLVKIVQPVPHDRSGGTKVILILEELSRLPLRTVKF
jgi:hypothetical protein